MIHSRANEEIDIGAFALRAVGQTKEASAIDGFQLLFGQFEAFIFGELEQIAGATACFDLGNLIFG